MRLYDPWNNIFSCKNSCNALMTSYYAHHPHFCIKHLIIPMDQQYPCQPLKQWKNNLNLNQTENNSYKHSSKDNDNYPYLFERIKMHYGVILLKNICTKFFSKPSLPYSSELCYKTAKQFSYRTPNFLKSMKCSILYWVFFKSDLLLGMYPND